MNRTSETMTTEHRCSQSRCCNDCGRHLTPHVMAFRADTGPIACTPSNAPQHGYGDESEGGAMSMPMTNAELAVNVAARRERERLVPHVGPCDDDGCYCPDDVFWKRLLGDDDPCAPGKDWVAAALGEADDAEVGE